MGQSGKLPSNWKPDLSYSLEDLLAAAIGLRSMVNLMKRLAEVDNINLVYATTMVPSGSNGGNKIKPNTHDNNIATCSRTPIHGVQRLSWSLIPITQTQVSAPRTMSICSLPLFCFQVGLSLPHHSNPSFSTAHNKLCFQVGTLFAKHLL